ncbi:MAG: dienelactone hydrolase family protein [Herpetosiphon sp.]
MCYDDQARPPLPPGTAGPAHGEDLVLTARDGTPFAAFLARSEQPSTGSIIIYPDVRGLHQFYKELALRFAEVGISAIAIDYFGRTAGLTSRDEGFEFWPHVQQLQMGSFEQDVQAAIDVLHNLSPRPTSIFVVGFCMGGALTLKTGTNPNFGFAGLIPFYAGLSRDLGGGGTALELAKRVKYPVLAMFGGADEGIPQTEVQSLDKQLDIGQIAHEVVVYPGAPHSFFDRRATQYAEASADAWTRALAFIASHSHTNATT